MRHLRPPVYLQHVRLRAPATSDFQNLSGAIRRLHTSPIYCTDGVYKDLTAMRVRTPWVEALRKKREEGIDPTKKSNTPAAPPDRDLKPKKMSDSFHRVVNMAPSAQYSV